MPHLPAVAHTVGSTATACVSIPGQIHGQILPSSCFPPSCGFVGGRSQADAIRHGFAGYSRSDLVRCLTDANQWPHSRREQLDGTVRCHGVNARSNPDDFEAWRTCMLASGYPDPETGRPLNRNSRQICGTGPFASDMATPRAPQPKVPKRVMKQRVAAIAKSRAVARATKKHRGAALAFAGAHDMPGYPSYPGQGRGIAGAHEMPGYPSYPGQGQYPGTRETALAFAGFYPSYPAARRNGFAGHAQTPHDDHEDHGGACCASCADAGCDGKGGCDKPNCGCQ